jgi:hypothetical protein
MSAYNYCTEIINILDNTQIQCARDHLGILVSIDCIYYFIHGYDEHEVVLSALATR